MKTRTKRLAGAAAISGLILATGAAVFAHGGYGPGWGGHGMSGGGGYGMHGGGYGMHRGGYGMHGGMMGGPGGMRGFMGGPGGMLSGDPVAYTDQRLADLKQALTITAEQETAWDRFETATRERAKLMTAHHQVMHGGARGTVSTEQRLDMMQEGARHMERLAKATRELFETLSAEQKEVVDRRGGLHHGGPRWAH